MTGVRINNFEAGSVWDVNRGVRERYDIKEAFLPDSLFLDFLLENGLRVSKGGFTRDVICMDFNYGSRSYEDDIKRFEKSRDEILSNEALDPETKAFKAGLYDSLIARADENMARYDRKPKSEIRRVYYEDGATITHKTKKGEETIHYRMLFRTPGKAKRGSCMFIREDMLEKARGFLRMGIKLPEHGAKIVEMGAYQSLTASSIISRIKIRPEEILVLRDVESVYRTTASCVEINGDGHCAVVSRDDYPIKNVMFDGQALIDSSIFPDWADGYILLRHHFCKMAAFKTHIQEFFKDRFGDCYPDTWLTDMFGNKIRARDVKLITTDNAMKWLKFEGVTFGDWSRAVESNGCLFGIVKTSHKSKLGDSQRMSYQMVNALDERTIGSVLLPTLDYITKLKTDDGAFITHLKSNANFANDYEALAALYERNPGISESDFFRARRARIIRGYVSGVRTGKILQDADNLTIVGSPYAMLMHSAGDDPLTDPTFKTEAGSIQCFTERFGDGEYLAEFRSPFNNRSNLGHLHNIRHPLLKRYFDFGRQIIAVNMNGTDMQARNNGQDQDSDMIYVTNQKDIVSHAEFCHRHYPTVVNAVPRSPKRYDDVPSDYAEVDNRLAASQRIIGESSNLAQVCLSYTYNFGDRVYKDSVDVLAVIAQLAIDSAKGEFDLDLQGEVKHIRNLINLKTNGYPSFWPSIRPGFSPEKINRRLHCPMNEVSGMRASRHEYATDDVPFSQFLVPHEWDGTARLSKAVAKLIDDYAAGMPTGGKIEWEDWLLMEENFERLCDDIRRLTLGKKYQGLVYTLLRGAFSDDGSQSPVKTKNRGKLLAALYAANPEVMLSCFKG